MTEKLPNNFEEALEFIREQQAEISHLQAENSSLKDTVNKQNIMLSNLTGSRRILRSAEPLWRTG